MALDAEQLLHSLTQGRTREAWRVIVDRTRLSRSASQAA